MSFSILDARTDMWKKFGASPGVQTPRKSALLIFVTLPAFAGCASHGAPSFVLFGAFFPAWTLCAFIGIFGAIAARGIFVTSKLDSGSVPAFCVFIGRFCGRDADLANLVRAMSMKSGGTPCRSFHRDYCDRCCSGALRRAHNLDPSIYGRCDD
jgi:hypothetical protein